MAAPQLVTLDVFGTVLDWRTGLEAACREAGWPLPEGGFDRVVDAQGRLEQGPYLNYATVTRRSLVEGAGMPEAEAARIAAGVGRWLLHPDAPVLRELMRRAPCAAMTNSDRLHGEDVQARLGFWLDDWLCAEDVRSYKPDPVFWHRMAQRRRIAPGPAWWHVSAYADYDLEAARGLGLVTVFVDRPHARPGPATHAVRDLHGVLDLLAQACG